LLPFSNPTEPDAVNGDGRPWGDGTAIAERAHPKPGKPATLPYDTGCVVKTLIGGYEAMGSIRDAFEQAIGGADPAVTKRGKQGHVYISDWRMNAQRDLSSTNPWGTFGWKAGQEADPDQTALGFIFRLMQAGILVRILLWRPTKVTGLPSHPHVADHHYIAEAVREHSHHLDPNGTLPEPLGIVALDARTAQGSNFGTHHQKAIVVRTPTCNVAFCGGVDLAFTRRDAPEDLASYDPTKTRFLKGDWQSGDGIPSLDRWPASTIWPPQGPNPGHGPTPDYTALQSAPKLEKRQGSDLEVESRWHVPIYGSTKQIWHDQHLRLEGPIVQTLEDQFCERWRDTAPVCALPAKPKRLGDDVAFSSAQAFDAQTGAIHSLPSSTDATLPTPGPSTVQMLRTIPWRNARTGPPFKRAEFTVMGGVTRAMSAAKELILIFDQYFWSLPVAHLLNHRMQVEPSLRVIVVLPPYADSEASVIHRARRRALEALTDALDETRVRVYNLWHPGEGRGIYVHAKCQTYDGALLICGSANLNRRSLACDSELSCAVLDPTVVSQHQARLWELLFGFTGATVSGWPGLDLNVPGNGQRFFDKFNIAAKDNQAFVRPDPWRASAPALPNGVPVEYAGGWADEVIERVFDPTSIVLDIEPRVYDQTRIRGARSDEVLADIELYVKQPDGTVISPGRRQS
jgi:phosphatidylserine/phosphatidylglycerophosphate/cardiolipin synthase-like enzyme